MATRERRRRWLALGAVALVAATWVTALARAEDDFYRGKTVTIVIGSAVGGAYDQYGRTLARHIGRHIPGAPAVVPQNMPGAGSMTAVRYLDVTAPRDGTVMVTFNPSLIMQSIVAAEATNMKFTDVAWIGTATHEFRVCYAWHGTGVKTWDDLVKAPEFVVGVTGVGTGAYVNGAVLRNLFGVRMRQIMGYPGSAQQRVAIERGELDGGCSEWNAIPEHWIRDRQIFPIVRWLRETPAGFPESVPFVGDLATDDTARQIITMLTAPSELGNPFIASKQVPADRVAMLRKAFTETMNDPEFLTEAERQKMPIEPMTGEQAAAICDEIYRDINPSLIAAAREAMK
ncbi:MAG: Bug family tripartite tricarboxylate transporter substrate binding protein [Gemmatimonas sp.]